MGRPLDSAGVPQSFPMQTRHFVVRTKVFGLRRGRCWRCMGQEVRWRGARAACLSAAMRVRCARRNTHTTDTQHQRHVVKYIRAQELWSRGLQAPLWSCRSRPVLRNLWPRAPPRSRGRRPQRAPLWSCRSRPVLRNPRLSAPPRSRGRRPTLRLLVPAGSGCASGCCSVAAGASRVALWLSQPAVRRWFARLR